MIWAIWVVLCAGALAAVLMLHLKRSRERRDLLINRLRTSAMYEDIHRLLTGVNSEMVETLVLRRQDITLKLLTGRSITLDFRAHHIDPLTNESLLVMAQSVLVDLPILQDSRYFTCLTPGRKDPDPRYIYTMRHSRKDYLLRTMRGQL